MSTDDRLPAGGIAPEHARMALWTLRISSGVLLLLALSTPRFDAMGFDGVGSVLDVRWSTAWMDVLALLARVLLVVLSIFALARARRWRGAACQLFLVCCLMAGAAHLTWLAISPVTQDLAPSSISPLSGFLSQVPLLAVWSSLLLVSAWRVLPAGISALCAGGGLILVLLGAGHLKRFGPEAPQGASEIPLIEIFSAEAWSSVPAANLTMVGILLVSAGFTALFLREAFGPRDLRPASLALPWTALVAGVGLHVLDVCGQIAVIQVIWQDAPLAMGGDAPDRLLSRIVHARGMAVTLYLMAFSAWAWGRARGGEELDLAGPFGEDLEANSA